MPLRNNVFITVLVFTEISSQSPKIVIASRSPSNVLESNHCFLSLIEVPSTSSIQFVIPFTLWEIS